MQIYFHFERVNWSVAKILHENASIELPNSTDDRIKQRYTRKRKPDFKIVVGFCCYESEQIIWSSWDPGRYSTRFEWKHFG